MSAIRVAVLTVSDTASSNPALDRSGPKLKELIKQHLAYDVPEAHYRIVPDDVGPIQSAINEWSHSGEVDWVITTGGTGFGVRDVTPEAIAPLIERPAPGLTHLLLSSSLTHTPLAALSRPVSGTIRSTLITTFPGSVKAVQENFEALLQGGVLGHAVELIRGGSGRAVHASLALALAEGSKSETETETESSSSASLNSSRHVVHHHHHHHHHSHTHPKPRSQAALSHDPSAPVSARHRKSPFPQITLQNALELIKQNIHRLPAETLPVNHNLRGRILAEDIYAPQDVPIRPTTSVDGYALRSTDPPGTYPVLTSLSLPPSHPLPPRTLYRINTGAPLPPGADAVIMVEDTELISTFKPSPSLPPEEKEVRILLGVGKGEDVRKAGSDVRRGERVFREGERVSAGGGEVGALVFVGRKEVKVYKKPTIAILSTGNELVDLHDAADPDVSASTPTPTPTGWGGIYDTNRPSLRAVLESLGYAVVDIGIVKDDIQSHTTALLTALTHSDLVLTTGGTSMGPTDLLKPVIERYLGGTIHFGRVGVKPGKPTTFASVPVAVPAPSLGKGEGGGGGEAGQGEGKGEGKGEGQGERELRKPIFALPGNPASALVTFYIFVLPALRRMGGYDEKGCELPRVMVQVQNPMPLDPRVEFHRVVIKSSFSPSLSPSSTPPSTSPVFTLKAYSTGSQRSSRVASLAGANGLVILPTLGEMQVQATREGKGKEPKEAKTRLEAGEWVEAVLIGEIEME